MLWNKEAVRTLFGFTFDLIINYVTIYTGINPLITNCVTIYTGINPLITNCVKLVWWYHKGHDLFVFLNSMARLSSTFASCGFKLRAFLYAASASFSLPQR